MRAVYSISRQSKRHAIFIFIFHFVSVLNMDVCLESRCVEETRLSRGIVLNSKHTRIATIFESRKTGFRLTKYHNYTAE